MGNKPKDMHRQKLKELEIVHLIFPMEISTTKLEKVYDQKSLHAAMKDRITEIKILSYK